MSTKAAPTKGNLLAEKKKLALAQIGYNLMDRKRNILIREMVELIDEIRQLQGEIEKTFGTAYAALQKANITTGLQNDLAENVPIDNSLEIAYRSVMGVELPILTCDMSAPKTIPYGMQNSNSVLDDAFLKFVKVKQICARVAQIENSVYRLADAIKKTQKRANALKNIIIPSSSETIREITAVLEEKDREEFSRMKVIKQNKQQ